MLSTRARLTDSMQATRIQRTWKRAPKLFDILQCYIDVGPTKTNVAAIGYQLLERFPIFVFSHNFCRFNALLKKLRRPEVIAAGKACIQRIHHLACRHVPADAPRNPVNTRVFLAAAIIAYFQDDIFPVIGPLETRLIACATTLLDTFDQIVLSAHTLRDWRLVPADVVRVFCTTLLVYVQLFAECKTPDAAKFIQRLQQSLLDLYAAARVQAPPTQHRDEPEVALYAYHSQIERVRHMVLQISGPQILALFDAEHPPPPTPPTPLVFRRTARWTAPTHETLAHELFFDSQFAVTLADIHPPKKLYKGFRVWKTLELATTSSTPCFARAMYALRDVIDASNDIAKDTFSDTDILTLSERFAGLDTDQPAALDILATVLDTLIPLMPSSRAELLRAQWTHFTSPSAAQQTANNYAAALRLLHDTAPHMAHAPRRLHRTHPRPRPSHQGRRRRLRARKLPGPP
jgi:hypothetical protein